MGANETDASSIQVYSSIQFFRFGRCGSGSGGAGGGSDVRDDALADLRHRERPGVALVPLRVLVFQRLERPALGEAVVVCSWIVQRVARRAEVFDFHRHEGGDGVGEEL